MKNIKNNSNIHTEIVQTYLDQWSINVIINGVCVHSQHVDNEDFTIIKKEYD